MVLFHSLPTLSLLSRFRKITEGVLGSSMIELSRWTVSMVAVHRDSFLKGSQHVAEPERKEPQCSALITLGFGCTAPV